MRKRAYALKKIRLRQSWNKYNLYNLSRARNVQTEQMTFFQQKWQAKSSSRAYHGEHIREKQWQGMFRPRLNSVVPMDHVYLASSDGSEQAAGRGSGLQTKEKQRRIPRTPYMNMVYAPMERRLDMAIFRSLFASSARQARQFVVHGSVKVNGKKMIYPGYLLNPGDMFQVDTERVLYATGARKDAKDLDVEDPESLGLRTEQDLEQKADESAQEVENEEAPIKDEGDVVQASKPDTSPKEQLSDLLSRAKSILSDTQEDLTGKRKRDLRAFQRSVRSALSHQGKSNTDNPAQTTSLDAQLSQLLSTLDIGDDASQPKDDTATSKDAKEEEPTKRISEEDSKALRRALIAASENPIDDSKAYATPWRPREYMSAFAFIPRYLEVNQNICSAVYLRHPVARPGLAEVPTPFGDETSTLAFNWYLRRR